LPEQHPEVTAELKQQQKCIVITVAGGSKTTTFRIFDPTEDLSAAGSPCPAWAQKAVQAWKATPVGAALLRKLAELLGGTPAEKGPEGTTIVDRRRGE
jgi:hypothetical protein